MRTSGHIGDIADEIDGKQDVEIVITGHLACVVGIVDLGGGRYSVTIADDEEQNGNPADCVETTCTWDGSGFDGELAGYDILYFVVECPTEGPSPTENTSWGRVKGLFR